MNYDIRVDVFTSGAGWAIRMTHNETGIAMTKKGEPGEARHKARKLLRGRMNEAITRSLEENTTLGRG